MKNLIALVIAAALTFSGCSKKDENFKVEDQNGIKIYSNTDVPNDPSAKLELKKLFTISSEAQADTNAYLKQPITLTADAANNIYILDIRSMSVKKFDAAGNFIKSIGRSGQGPGELFYPSIMYFDKDTLIVMSAGSRKLSKFDADGNFFYEKPMKDQTQMQLTKFSRDGLKSASYVMKMIQKEGGMPDVTYSLSIININDLTEKNAINSQNFALQDFISGKIDMNDLLIPFAPGNDNVYVSENSDNQYRIFGYDYEGKKQFEIRKDFKMIRYENTEKEDYIASIKKSMQGLNDVKVGNYKKALVTMHTDKYGRLLVYPNVDRNVDKEGVYLDIFKDGKFLNRINYDIQDKGNNGFIGMSKASEFFIGDRLYVLNAEDLKLDVYEY